MSLRGRLSTVSFGWRVQTSVCPEDLAAWQTSITALRGTFCNDWKFETIRSTTMVGVDFENLV